MEKVNMSKEELILFFRKYDIVDLESFKSVLDFVFDYDTTVIKEALNDVCVEYLYQYDVAFELHERQRGYQFSSITSVNRKLNLKELEFLYNIADSALMCMSSIEKISFEDEIYELSIITESVNEEIHRMNSVLGKEKVLTFKNTKKKD